MRYPALLAHVYSSGDAYGTSRARHVLAGFRPNPSVGNLTIQVGRAPRWLYRARRRLFAINPLAGGNLAGWLAGTHPAPPFRLRRGELSRPWYTTVLLERAPVGLTVQELDATIGHEAMLREAAVLLASEFSANVIERLELRGLFLQGATGEWVKTPDLVVRSPSIYVGRPDAALQSDLQGAQQALQTFYGGATSTRSWVDWAHRALLTAEPWSQFVWFMFSLEQATIAHYRWMSPPRRQTVRATAESHVRAALVNPNLNWSRPSITMRFSAMASDLSPSTAAADTNTFYRLRRIRDDLLHGTLADAPDGVHQSAVRVLAVRYARLVSLTGVRP